MKSETYFKVLFRWLTKSICFTFVSKEIRFIWLPRQFSLPLPWTLDQYQPNSAEDSQTYPIPAHFAPIWKQTEECPILSHQSAVGQQQESRRSQCCRPSVFVKLHFVWLLGLPGTMQTGVDVWRGSGGFWLSSGTGQGTKVLSYYVLWLVSHTGAVLSSSHDCILTRLGRLRSSFWKRFSFSMVSYKGLSRFFFFIWGVGGVGWYSSVREKYSFKFL